MSNPAGNYQAPIPKKATTSLNNQFGYSLHSLKSPSITPSPNNISASASTSPPPSSRTPLQPVISPSDFDSCPVILHSSPCYFSSLDNCCQHQTIIPQLEDLLDDCFKHSINQPIDPLAKDIVIHFTKFVNNLHTEENLAFLIEIFKYEYYYDKIFPHNIDSLKLRSSSPVHYSNSFLNRSLDQSIDSLPYPTASKLSPKPKDDSSAVFMDDIEVTANLQEVWDNLRDSNLSDSSDHRKSITSTISESIVGEEISQQDRELLADQWNRIINSYIQNDAPDQINISNKSSREILGEHQHNLGNTHNPIVLVNAKNEILQLIKENAYVPFTKNYKPSCDELTSECAAKKPSTPTRNEPKQEAGASPSSLNYDSKVNTPTQYTNELTVPKPNRPIFSPYLTDNASGKKKSRFLHLTTPSGNASSSSSSSASALLEADIPKSKTIASSSPSSPAPASSISNLWGHFKVHHNQSFASTPTSPVNLSSSNLKSKTFASTNESGSNPKIVRPSSTSNAERSPVASSPSTTGLRFGKLWKSKRK